MRQQVSFLRWGLGVLGTMLLVALEGSVPATAAEMPAKSVSERDAVKPMAIGGWLLSTSLFGGAVYNSNVNQSAAKVSSWGERVVPGFAASLENGIHQTSIYGLADLQNYSGSGVTDYTTIDAKVGITQIYFPQRDLTIRFNGDFTRQADVFGSSAFARPRTPLGVTSQAPIASTSVAPQVAPTRFNQYSGQLSADKKIGRTTVGLGVGAVNTQFDSGPVSVTNRDGTIYTVNGRGSFDVTPRIYVFVDPSVNWQRYSNSTRDAEGYRVTAGFGTSGPGIWLGEIFGGYQAEKNDIVGTYDGGVIGVRLSYSPTRFWDLRATIDETLGASSIATGGVTGVASHVATALLNVAYNGLPKGRTAAARFGYVRTDFVNSSRDDDGWLAGANIGYEVWRNFGVTLDYQFKSVDSNVAGQSFDQQVVSLGASYKY